MLHGPLSARHCFTDSFCLTRLPSEKEFARLRGYFTYNVILQNFRNPEYPCTARVQSRKCNSKRRNLLREFFKWCKCNHSNLLKNCYRIILYERIIRINNTRIVFL